MTLRTLKIWWVERLTMITVIPLHISIKHNQYNLQQSYTYIHIIHTMFKRVLFLLFVVLVSSASAFAPPATSISIRQEAAPSTTELFEGRRWNFNEGRSPWGMSRNAEIWNGRLAQVCFVSFEAFNIPFAKHGYYRDASIIHFWNIWWAGYYFFDGLADYIFRSFLPTWSLKLTHPPSQLQTPRWPFSLPSCRNWFRARVSWKDFAVVTLSIKPSSDYSSFRLSDWLDGWPLRVMMITPNK